MAYITFQQYVDIYGTCPVSEAQFPVYAGIASDIIDTITQFRIEQWGGVSALPVFLQNILQKATAAQCQYLLELGISTVTTGQTGQGFTVGKVSINGGALANGNLTAAQLLVSPAVRAMLEQTPLMERRTPTCSDLYRRFY